MSIDIDQVLKDMAGAATDAAKDDAGDIQAYAKDIMDAQKDSLKELAQARLKGDIDEETFNRELEREKKVVEAQLLTIQIMTKALAQKAMNAAIDVFVKAVKAAI